MRRSEDVIDVFLTSYVRSIYGLCTGGYLEKLEHHTEELLTLG